MHIPTLPAFIHARLKTSEAAHFQTLHNKIECILLKDTNDRPQFMDFFYPHMEYNALIQHTSKQQQ